MIEAQNSNSKGEAYVAYDRFGNQYTASDIAVPDLGITTFTFPQANDCQAGIFTLYFNDAIRNTGCGFDEGTILSGPLTLGQLRQQAVCQAFTDLSELIVPANPSVSVNILVEESAGCNNDLAILPDVGGELAVGGPFYRIPFGVNDGIVHGEVWKAVNGAMDYPTSIHGILRFNFDNPSQFQQFYLDFTTAATGAGLEDLYTVALHEAIHALGFGSLLESNGGSVLHADDLYSVYDTHLDYETGIPGVQIPFIVVAGPGPYNSSVNPTLAPGNPMPALVPDCLNSGLAVLFDGSNNPNQDTYAPGNPAGAFNQGTDVSHFNCISGSPCPTGMPPGGNGYVMNFCTGDNAQQRTPNQAEVNTLCDLGYSLSGTYGTDPANPFTYKTYTVCPNPSPCIAAGGDDIYVMSPGSPDIDVTGVLSNDFSTNGPLFLFMENLEIVTEDPTMPGVPAGTLSNENNANGSFTYTPPAGFLGTVTLRYTPECGNGNLGNITFITIIIPFPPCNANNPIPGPCEMICYGDFEALTDPYAAPLSTLQLQPSVINTPDLVPSQFVNIGDPLSPYNTCGLGNAGGNTYPPPSSFTSPNNKYVAIASYAGNVESIFFELSQPLKGGETYSLGFDVYSGCTETLNFLFSETPPCPLELSNTGVGVTTNCVLGATTPYQYTPQHLETQTINPTLNGGGLVWQQGSFQFTVPASVGCLNYVTIYHNGTPEAGPQGDYSQYPLYDNFSLQPLCCSQAPSTTVEQVQCCLDGTPSTVTECTNTPNISIVDGRPAYVLSPGTHNWTKFSNDFITNGWILIPGSPIVLDVDLVIPPNTTLNIDDMDLYFTPNCRILVQRGDENSSFGGVLNIDADAGSVLLSGLCNAMWQGIQVEGPGRLIARIDNASGNNYASLLLDGTVQINDALFGVSAMNVPLMDVFNMNLPFNSVVEFDPLNNSGAIPFSTISQLGFGAFIGASSAKSTSGGACSIQSRTKFTNCLQGINPMLVSAE